MDEGLSKYRQHLVDAGQKSQADYDSTVFKLSGGALGLSFAFVDKFVQKGTVVRPGLLEAAWVLWIASLGLVLVSYYLSGVALRKALRQTDTATIQESTPGGLASILLDVCNFGSGLFFLVGVSIMVAFVHFNRGL